MTEKEAQLLLKKYRLGICTIAEKQAIERWYESLLSENENQKLSEQESQEIHDAVQSHLQIITKDSSVRRLRTRFNKNRKKLISLSVLLIIVFLSIVFFYPNHQSAISKNSPQNERFQNEILPGKYGATLKMDKLLQSNLHFDNKKYHTSINGLYDISVSDNKIVFANNMQKLNGNSILNTISTAKGEQYAIQLTDGTNIWLNADSKISFSLPFGLDSRHVKIEGQAYFEVAKDSTKPFIVETKNGSVRVLGTHFDVNSYKDEETEKITLLEGKILYSYINTHQKKDSSLILPGQQIIYRANQISITNMKNYKDAIAWKDGYFAFDNTDLISVMKQLSRWYDIDVIYRTPFANQNFFGYLKKGEHLSFVLNILEKSGVRFTVTGKTVTVL